MHLDDVFYLYANLKSNDIFLISMIILIVFLLILILIVSYISKEKEKKILEKKRLEYKQNLRKNIKVHNYDEDTPKEEKLPTSISKEEVKSINKKENIEEIKINGKQKEIKELEEEIEVIEVIDETTDEKLENIKNAIKENKTEQTINLNKWEQEQEESAIISYDELVKKAGAKKIVYKPSKKEENTFSTMNNNTNNKFKPSKVLSPVYGTHETIEQIDEKIDALARVERLNTNNEEENMKNDIEFLNKLKKFRSELGIK